MNIIWSIRTRLARYLRYLLFLVARSLWIASVSVDYKSSTRGENQPGPDLYIRFDFKKKIDGVGILGATTAYPAAYASEGVCNSVEVDAVRDRVKNHLDDNILFKSGNSADHVYKMPTFQFPE